MDMRHRIDSLGAIVAQLNAAGIFTTMLSDGLGVSAHYAGTPDEAIVVRMSPAGECVVASPIGANLRAMGRAVRYQPTIKAGPAYNYPGIITRVRANLDRVRAARIATSRREAELAEALAKGAEYKAVLDTAGAEALVSSSVVIENGYARIRLELHDDCRLERVVRRLAKALTERHEK